MGQWCSGGRKNDGGGGGGGGELQLSLNDSPSFGAV
jgi:hypothetical protein